MLVYRSDRPCRPTAAALAELRASLRSTIGLTDPAALHDGIVGALIDAGTLESAIADAFDSDADDAPPPVVALREVTVALAGAAWHSWRRTPDRIPPLLDRATTALGRSAAPALPSHIEPGVPEGFAYYAVYPEIYFDAAARFAEGPDKAGVCLGLRTIGTTLSACVTAALLESGWQIESWTVRPRGHPFDRSLRLAPALCASLAARRDRWFLVVDEGPGLSGSSFAGTVKVLTELGVPEHRIVLFPSWRTDGRGLRAASARAIWPALRQETGDFSAAWIGSQRLAGRFDARIAGDWSAGRWRSQWLLPGDPWPPVQPQHERRKYLAAGAERMLLRFAGLGRFGDRALQRAELLADAGFGAAPLDLGHGFLAERQLRGRPLRADELDGGLLGTIARYLAHRSARFQAEPAAGPAELGEMVVHNIEAGLGPRWAERATRHLREAVWGDGGCIVDGRMLPHEWIRGPDGDFKTDALDHGDGHFLPGPVDIAWDLAGTCVEFQLDPPAESALTARYGSYSGDRDVARRLPTYRLGYLAFRLGYCTQAAEALGTSLDGRRFRLAAARYAAALRCLLAEQQLPCISPAADPYPPHALIIFDADGTLRESTVPGQPCPLDSSQWRLRRGARATVRRLLARRNAARLGLASNQDRVGWGQVSLAEARSLLRDLARSLAGRPLPEEAIQLCPHRPDECCACRKPAPAMLERIMGFYRVPAERTLFVGDAETDREAARRAGAGFAWAGDFFGPASTR